MVVLGVEGLGGRGGGGSLLVHEPSSVFLTGWGRPQGIERFMGLRNYLYMRLKPYS